VAHNGAEIRYDRCNQCVHRPDSDFGASVKGLIDALSKNYVKISDEET
jgi:hypothetical protein